MQSGGCWLEERTPVPRLIAPTRIVCRNEHAGEEEEQQSRHWAFCGKLNEDIDDGDGSGEHREEDISEESVITRNEVEEQLP